MKSGQTRIILYMTYFHTKLNTLQIIKNINRGELLNVDRKLFDESKIKNFSISGNRYHS